MKVGGYYTLVECKIWIDIDGGDPDIRTDRLAEGFLDNDWQKWEVTGREEKESDCKRENDRCLLVSNLVAFNLLKDEWVDAAVFPTARLEGQPKDYALQVAKE